MLIMSKAPGFPKVEIVGNTLGEFIDNSHKEWAFFWGEDVSTNDIVRAWQNVLDNGYSILDGVTFELIA